MAKRGTLDDRFWAKVKRTEACWLWTAGFCGAGYGKIRLGAPSHRTVGAHRLSWELAKGPIPGGLSVCHHCDNPACVRPDHLFLGTHKDNMKDRQEKGRCIGEASGRAILSEGQVREIRTRAGTLALLGREYGVSPGCICAIRQRKTWKHL